jgi:outer membrane protein assembly factor BamB
MASWKRSRRHRTSSDNLAAFPTVLLFATIMATGTLVVASISLGLSGSVASASGSTPASTGLSSNNISSLAPQWAMAQGHSNRSAPISVDGLIIFSCAAGVCAEKKGAMVWTNKSFSVDPASTITISGADGYDWGESSSPQQSVGAFNLKTGATVWMSTLSTHEVQSPVVVGDGLALVGDYEGNLLALNASTGKMAWETNVSGTEPLDVTPVFSGNQIFEATEGASVDVLDVSNGDIAWEDGSPTVSNISAVVPHDGSLYALGSDSAGANIAVFPQAGCGSSECPATRTLRIGSGYNASVDSIQFDGNDAVVVAAGNLYVVNASTFDPVWNNIPKGYGTGDTGVSVVSNDLLIVGDGDLLSAYKAAGCGSAYCQPVWSKRLSLATDAQIGTPTVTGNTLYVGTSDALYQFGIGAGSFVGSGPPAQLVPSASPAGAFVEYSFQVPVPTTVTPGNYPIFGWVIESTTGQYEVAGDMNQVFFQLKVPAGTAPNFIRRAFTVGGLGHSSVPSTTIVQEPPSTAVIKSETSSITFGLPGGVTSGAALVAVVGAGTGLSGDTVSSISGGGVTWTRAARLASDVGDQEVWYGLDSRGSATNSSVVVSMASGTTTLGGIVWQLVGVASTGALDTTGTLAGESSTMTAPSMTTSDDGDLVAVAFRSQSALTSCQSTLPDGWPDPEGSAPQYFNELGYEIGAAKGPFSSTCTQASAGPWAAVGLALKPAPALSKS